MKRNLKIDEFLPFQKNEKKKITIIKEKMSVILYFTTNMSSIDFMFRIADKITLYTDDDDDDLAEHKTEITTNNVNEIDIPTYNILSLKLNHNYHYLQIDGGNLKTSRTIELYNIKPGFTNVISNLFLRGILTFRYFSNTYITLTFDGITYVCETFEYNYLRTLESFKFDIAFHEDVYVIIIPFFRRKSCNLIGHVKGLIDVISNQHVMRQIRFAISA